MGHNLGQWASPIFKSKDRAGPGPGLGQNDLAQAHSGPNPKKGFTKARARPGRAWAWPELIPSNKTKTRILVNSYQKCYFIIFSSKVPEFYQKTQNQLKCMSIPPKVVEPL